MTETVDCIITANMQMDMFGGRTLVLIDSPFAQL